MASSQHFSIYKMVHLCFINQKEHDWSREGYVTTYQNATTNGRRKDDYVKSLESVQKTCEEACFGSKERTRAEKLHRDYPQGSTMTLTSL